MNSRLLDVLLNAGNHTRRVVCQRVDVELCCLLQELVDEHRAIWCEANSISDVRLECLLVIHDSHRTTTQYITRTHEYRISDFLGHFSRFIDRRSHAVCGLWDSKILQESAESLSILCEVDRIW